MTLARRDVMKLALATGVSAGLAPVMSRAAEARDADLRPARAALTRLFGPQAQDFRLKLTTDSRLPWYHAGSEGGHLSLTANSPVALVRGTYAALKAEGAAALSWEGDRIALPRQHHPENTSQVQSPFAHRVYFNPCTYGYTMAFWGWDRWEREIDWMAAHGIDMPLAMEGQEYVWRKLWAEQGLSEAELDGYFSGPAFLPWHRMGNIEGYQAPLPASFIDAKRALQQQILTRLHQMKMTPIVPAFAGYVPKAWAMKHADARVSRMEPWGGFHDTWWLDPADPWFVPIARRFQALYTETYGPARYVLADSFNEMLPPISKAPSAPSREDQLAAYGRRLFEAICGDDPERIWVIQGWMFSFQPYFWDADAVAAFLRDVPDARLMVLDIANDSYPGVWQKTRTFGGKSWVFGYIHNFGGNNPLFGDLEAYRSELLDLGTRTDTGRLNGFGMFPEGLNTNSVIYEYIFDQAWKPDARSVEDWLKIHLTARYGHITPGLISGWAELKTAVYRTRVWTSSWWKGRFGAYLFFKRPHADLVDFEGDPGDRTHLRRAVTALLNEAPAFKSAPLFRIDVAAALGHLALLEMDVHLPDLIRAHLKSEASATSGWAAMRALALDLDRLLGLQPQGLAQWIKMARDYGRTAGEKAYYVENAKAQVSIWGGDNVLADYASKAWQGLMRDFYVPRWDRFFSAITPELLGTGGAHMAEITADLAHWEHDWVKRPTAYRRRVPRSPEALMRQILQKLDQL